jgi:hypothetical protein
MTALHLLILRKASWQEVLIPFRARQLQPLPTLNTDRQGQV